MLPDRKVSKVNFTYFGLIVRLARMKECCQRFVAKSHQKGLKFPQISNMYLIYYYLVFTKVILELLWYLPRAYKQIKVTTHYRF